MLSLQMPKVWGAVSKTAEKQPYYVPNWGFAACTSPLTSERSEVRIVQDARLNYVEQHAERVGLDAGRLEAARVAASRASPLADALDTVQSHVNAAAMQQLMPCLVQLVRPPKPPLCFSTPANFYVPLVPGCMKPSLASYF